jgi:hypothetical protein
LALIDAMAFRSISALPISGYLEVCTEIWAGPHRKLCNRPDDAAINRNQPTAHATLAGCERFTQAACPWCSSDVWGDGGQVIDGMPSKIIKMREDRERFIANKEGIRYAPGRQVDDQHPN